jgi:hypothetical protein
VALLCTFIEKYAMKFIPFTLISFIIVSCGTAVHYDYERATDFSIYNSYSYYNDIESGLSQLDNSRIKRAIDSVLIDRGLVKSDSPDFLINFYASEMITNSGSSIGIGVGGGGGNVGVGVSGGIPIGGNTILQKMTIDLVDASRDRLFWKAIAESKFSENSSPEQKTEHYYRLMLKIFKNYPPEK